MREPVTVRRRLKTGSSDGKEVEEKSKASATCRAAATSGSNKSAAEQIAKASSGLDSGKKKAEEVIRKATDELPHWPEIWRAPAGRQE